MLEDRKCRLISYTYDVKWTGVKEWRALGSRPISWIAIILDKTCVIRVLARWWGQQIGESENSTATNITIALLILSSVNVIIVVNITIVSVNKIVLTISPTNTIQNIQNTLFSVKRPNFTHYLHPIIPLSHHLNQINQPNNHFHCFSLTYFNFFTVYFWLF